MEPFGFFLTMNTHFTNKMYLLASRITKVKCCW